MIILKSFIPIIEKLESYFNNGKKKKKKKKKKGESGNIVYGCLNEKEKKAIT